MKYSAKNWPQEWDEVVVSGYSDGRFYYNCPAVVATAGQKLYGTMIKVWPIRPDDGSKLWFNLDHARIEIVHRPYEYLTYGTRETRR
jgi:hypothetical protein